MTDAAPAADTTSWKDRPARYWRDPDRGGEQDHRVAFARVQFWSWIGGRGYVPVQRVMVWNPTTAAGDTFEEAAESAGPGERFAAVMTEEQFARKTFPVSDAERGAQRFINHKGGVHTVAGRPAPELAG